MDISDIDFIRLLAAQEHRFFDDVIDNSCKFREKVLGLEVVLSIICVFLHEAALLERADSFVHHEYHEEFVVGIEGCTGGKDAYDSLIAEVFSDRVL